MLYRILVLLFFLLILLGIAGVCGGAFLILWAVFSWSKIIGWILVGILAIYSGLWFLVFISSLIDRINQKLGDK